MSSVLGRQSSEPTDIGLLGKRPGEALHSTKWQGPCFRETWGLEREEEQEKPKEVLEHPDGSKFQLWKEDMQGVRADSARGRGE